jgi:hypothetical protein
MPWNILVGFECEDWKFVMRGINEEDREDAYKKEPVVLKSEVSIQDYN